MSGRLDIGRSHHEGAAHDRQRSGSLNEAPFHAAIAEGPPAGVAYWLHTRDGTRLRVGLWTPGGRSRGTILAFPGRTEYVEKYGRAAADFARRGLGTFVIDWRGQGLSDRVANDPFMSHVNRFADYHEDVAAMVGAAERLDLPRPWYLLGHSMGACIGLGAVLGGLPVAACAFTGPMWGIALPRFQRMAAWSLSWAAQAAGRSQRFAPGSKAQETRCYVLSVPFDGNRLTTDPEMFRYMVSQAEQLAGLQTGAPSMGWLFQTLQETRRLSGMQSPDVPAVAFCGEHEIVVDVLAVRDRMHRWPRGALRILRGGRHDILLERSEIRDKVIKEITDLFAIAGTAELP